MEYSGLKLPGEFVSLLEAGVWPTSDEDINRQNLEPIISLETLQHMVPDQNALVLFPPPFNTVADRIKSGEEFWTWAVAAPSEIDPLKTLLIGDFGLVTDTALALDYRETGEPKVIRLCWYLPNPEANNKWELVSPTFAQFCKGIGLLA